MTVHSADVAILGGGFAAWVCACALRDRGVAVAVLHRRQAAAGPAVGEYLPPEGISAIAALGLGDILDAPAHRACAGVLSAWGDARPVRQDTLMHPGSRALNLDRAVLVRDLAARGRSRGVGTVSCSGVPALGGRPGAWVVDLATPAGAAQVRARFLVDATGRSAALARARGARVLRQDGLVGLAAVHAPAPVDDSALRIESLPDGWCYAAPLSGDRLAAVFLTDAVGLPAGQSARTALAAERLRHSRLIGPHLGSARPAFRVPSSLLRLGSLRLRTEKRGSAGNSAGGAFAEHVRERRRRPRLTRGVI